jgi:hypothetical protein
LVNEVNIHDPEKDAPQWGAKHPNFLGENMKSKKSTIWLFNIAMENPL